MSDCPVVKTSLSRLKGRVVNNVDKGRDLYLYSSIPFAKLLVGYLPFKPPIKPDPWSEVLDGSHHSAIPLQDWKLMEELLMYIPSIKPSDPVKMSEDCLYLSVYTSTTSKAANLPVLFWIYGGAFNSGSQDFYDGSVLAALHDVVVVVPNYRLSIFGFLSLGRESDTPGNYGLLDQLMAMKWTQEHIKNFGGNPDNITIFGESAGAMSVNHHVVSPMSRGCFHKAISHSGSIYLGFFNDKTSDRNLDLLLKQLKIEVKDQAEVVKKLKSIPAKEIMAALEALKENLTLFLPAVDGKFVPHNLDGLYKDKVNPVPYIVGFNNTEGGGFLSILADSNFAKGFRKEALIAKLKGSIGQLFYKGLPDTAFDLIVEGYRKDLPDDELKWSKVYGNVTGDILFVNPGILCANQHLESDCPTYMYVMTQTTKLNHDPDYGPESARKPSFCECDHGDDVLYTFGLPLHTGETTFDVKFTEDEKKLSQEWMKYIANFAKNGDPNIGESVELKWPQLDFKEKRYLSVQQPCTVGKKYSADRFRFWKEIIEPMRSTTKSS